MMPNCVCGCGQEATHRVSHKSGKWEVEFLCDQATYFVRFFDPLNVQVERIAPKAEEAKGE